MALWWTRCSGCEKPLTNLHGGQYCTTPGCKYASNLPVSKTGLSSPSNPLPDPALATESRDLERAAGWTPAMPFTECQCKIALLDEYGDDVQTAAQPHFPDCPLYEEPETPLYAGPDFAEDEAELIPGATTYKVTVPSFDIPEMAWVTCDLCKSDLPGIHADSCPAKPGHTCKLCGEPCHHVTFADGSQGWRHDMPSDACGYAATPKATKFTGTCIHGNPLYKGCQACDWQSGG